MNTFYQLGEKILFLLFSYPFNHFFSPTCYLAIYLAPGGPGVKLKNIHLCCKLCHGLLSSDLIYFRTGLSSLWTEPAPAAPRLCSGWTPPDPTTPTSSPSQRSTSRLDNNWFVSLHLSSIILFIFHFNIYILSIRVIPSSLFNFIYFSVHPYIYPSIYLYIHYLSIYIIFFINLYLSSIKEHDTADIFQYFYLSIYPSSIYLYNI